MRGSAQKAYVLRIERVARAQNSDQGGRATVPNGSRRSIARVVEAKCPRRQNPVNA